MGLRDNSFYRLRKNRKEFKAWRASGYEAPLPSVVKTGVLRKYAIKGATWIETGTYRGDTTRVLSTIAARVISIEPEPRLYKKAVRRFKNDDDIELVNDTSEAAFPEIVSELSGDVCFWLDGHYSAGATFRGEVDSPIVKELEAIEQWSDQLGKLAVLVDDIRLFDPEVPGHTGYPHRSYLVDWAQRMGMNWSIEHDIFIAVRG